MSQHMTVFTCPVCKLSGFEGLDIPHPQNGPECRYLQGETCRHPKDFRQTNHNGQQMCLICLKYEPGEWYGEWSKQPVKVSYEQEQTKEN